jgi:hypothetical protein
MQGALNRYCAREGCAGYHRLELRRVASPTQCWCVATRLESRREGRGSRRLIEQLGGDFWMRRFPDAQVKLEFPSLLIDARCVGSTDLDHASSGGFALETGPAEVDAQIIGERGVAQSDQHRAAVLLYTLRPAAPRSRPPDESSVKARRLAVTSNLDEAETPLQSSNGPFVTDLQNRSAGVARRWVRSTPTPLRSRKRWAATVGCHAEGAGSSPVAPAFPIDVRRAFGAPG